MPPQSNHRDTKHKATKQSSLFSPYVTGSAKTNLMNQDFKIFFVLPK